jgi:hypothetical protein
MLRLLTVPLALLAITVAVMVAISRGGEVERSGASGAPTATPVADIPDGTSGVLTYRTGHEIVSVQLPDRTEIDRQPEKFDAGIASADDEWSASVTCAGDGASCDLRLRAINGGGTDYGMPVGANFATPRHLRWSPTGHTLAIAALDPSSGIATGIDYITHPAALNAVRAYDATGGSLSAFEWYGDQLLVAHTSTSGTQLQVVSLNGSVRAIANLAAPVNYFYPSPDGRTFAFTQDTAAGWHLFAVDTLTEEVHDHGPMGSGSAVPEAAPDIKQPMYIAWSPDGTALSFGGGYEPPYSMTTLDVVSGTKVRTEFTNGYPGEIRWNADATLIAVSTYDTLRTHHETHVVDPATGVSRHLLNGCVIVWSPDGRFLAVHGEDVPGIAIVDAVTGEHGQLTHTSTDAPLRWDPPPAE